MIGYLIGEIFEIGQGSLILLVGGVGYKILVPASLVSGWRVGEKIALRTYTYVREDVLSLFGFRTKNQLELFEKLLSVSGVGPKLALGVFNAGTAEEIVSAIRRAEVDFFTAVSGIGKKGAQRLIVELKSKVGTEEEIDLSDWPERDDAFKGLMGLGFSRGEAIQALKKIDKKIPVEEQIKLALKNG